MSDKNEQEFNRLWRELRDELRALLDEVQDYHNQFDSPGYDDAGWLKREEEISARLATIKRARREIQRFLEIGDKDDDDDPT
jgi:hypothetical protein